MGLVNTATSAVPQCDCCGKFIAWQDVFDGNVVWEEDAPAPDPWNPSIEPPVFYGECAACLAATL